MALPHDIDIHGEVDPTTGRAMVAVAFVSDDTAMIRYVPADQIDQLIDRLKSARSNAAIKAWAAAHQQEVAALNRYDCESEENLSPHGDSPGGEG